MYLLKRYRVYFYIGAITIAFKLLLLDKFILCIVFKKVYAITLTLFLLI